MNPILRIPAIVLLAAVFLVLLAITLASLFLTAWLGAAQILAQVNLPQLLPAEDYFTWNGITVAPMIVLIVSAIVIIPAAIASRFCWVGLEWVVEQYWLDSWQRWQTWKQQLLAK